MARNPPRRVAVGGPPIRRKALGQHHLRHGRLCGPLLDFLQIEDGVGVVEIGPGGGVLTRELLERGAHVAACEIDSAWAFSLRERLGRERSRRLSIAVVDALGLDWRTLTSGWRVAGNLPYNVGTAIVERLLAAAPAGTRACFLLQREVVERMAARAGEAAFGALSLLVEMRARSVRLATVRPGAFVPPPKVESAFVGLEIMEPPLPEHQMADLERLIRSAFAQRRKSLRNALAAGYGRESASAALAAAGLAPSRRAEELSLKDFLALRSALEKR